MIEKIKNYLEDVSLEMKKVSWPSFPELKGLTIVVLVVTLILASFIWGVDQIFAYLMGAFLT